MTSNAVESKKGNRSFCAQLFDELKKIAADELQNTQYKVGFTKTDIKKINPTF
tara:strand:- start:5507 stop:5665 length:159 start_codon:yes stop_codon:yes gene_type:complete